MLGLVGNAVVDVEEEGPAVGKGTLDALLASERLVM